MITEAKDLTKREYQLIAALVYEKSGINLGDQKMQLVRTRLNKRLREGNFRTFREYYQFVKEDESGRELTALIDAISTNTTHLFRENKHFEFLAERFDEWLSPEARRREPIRIWSAGCSSGEEPYSIAITAREALERNRRGQVKILATDISTRVLAKAQEGVFDAERLATVPKSYRRKYFQRKGPRDAERFEIVPAVRELITFARFNLMTPQFPFRNPFDVIFCRNVMIYFDKPTQEGLVRRYAHALRPGGYLLIGHSESLNSISHELAYVAPTIYRKP